MLTITPVGALGTRTCAGEPVIRPEGIPDPEEFVACTDTKYSVEFCNPFNWQLLPTDPVEHCAIGLSESVSTYAVAVYPVIDDVPEKLGGDQLTTKV